MIIQLLLFIFKLWVFIIKEMVDMNKKKILHEEIKKLQDDLNNLLKSRCTLNTKSLQLSQKLDKLIVEYLKTQEK